MEKPIKEIMGNMENLSRSISSEKKDSEIYEPSELQAQIDIIRREKSNRRGIPESEIDITDHDIQTAKDRIDSIKATRAYWEKIKMIPEESGITPEGLFSEYRKTFRVDRDNERVIKLLCLYFAKDKRFEEAGYSFKKGIALVGGVGCGKTTMMNFFSKRAGKDERFEVVSCRMIGYEFASTGFKAIIKHSNDKRCFDDLGTDEERKFYGDNINAVTSILFERYDSRIITHLTTNLTAGEIGEKYKDDRLISRMVEMFNILEFPKDSKDRRRE